MIIADFSTGELVPTFNELTQWDYGQILEIHGLNLPSTIEIHFARVSDSYAEVRIGQTINNVTTVKIPDVMLESCFEFRAYIFMTSEGSGETVESIDFYVKERQKPSDIITPDNINAFDQLVQIVGRVENQVISEEKMQQSIELYLNTHDLINSIDNLEIEAITNIDMAKILQG